MGLYGGSTPPPPDYKPVADASRESAEIAAQLGREQLAEGRWQYDDTMAVARPVVQAQLDIMRQTADQGADYYEYGKSFRPLEQQMLSQVQGQLTPAQIVRLGVSGLQLPASLGGRVQSAGVIAGAGNRGAASGTTPPPASPPQPAQQQTQQATTQTTPQTTQGTAAHQPRRPGGLVGFAQSGRQAQTGPRFPNSGVLPFLSSADMGRMLEQQGRDTLYAGPSAPGGAPIALPAATQRPTTQAAPVSPATKPPDLDAFRNDILREIDERIRRQQPPGTGPTYFNDGA